MGEAMAIKFSIKCHTVELSALEFSEYPFGVTAVFLLCFK